ncbi:adenylate kinase 7 isoform X4 [Syngnathus typhle]|uniref:adenylate kinase 7 isoform X4 n=1 Tax=Syngnathus typhle TaxID=161592 RepID=UPI002A6B5A66|nr:adenylate kinase 7 isoform X4 [Syngnathus typhle]
MDIHTQIRVFINDIDSFTSKCIAKCLSKHTIEGDGSAKKEGRTLKSCDSVPQSYEVVGTSSFVSEEVRPFVLEAYVQLRRANVLQKLMECDVIIYNITGHPEQVDEARWAVTALHDNKRHFKRPKMFILISTVMTWACSEPISSDELELPFTDDDFRRRIPHPNFKKHLELEKLVGKMGKMDRALFSTYVVVSGLQYGMGEQVFHLFFKMSWLGQENEIAVFGEGNNVVPTIHVSDLASVIKKIIEIQPKPFYLVAVDYSNNTMEDIVQSIACALGSGKIQRKPLEEAFLKQDFGITDIDLLRVNLCMEGVHLKELFSVHWLCEFGLVENIELVVEEYRQSRGLLPIRMCVLGPPAVGKSRVSQQICDHYKLHHIRLKETISETVSHLEFMIRNTPSDLDNEESTSATEAQELLNIFKENMEQNRGVSDDQLLVKVMIDKLMSNACKNQGFVLDGFPKTYEQAKELFHVDEHESDERASLTSLYNKKIMPEIASVNTPDNQLLLHQICERVGQPRNYEQRDHKVQDRETELMETLDKARREQKERDEARQRSAHWQLWSNTLKEKRQQEVQQLEVLSLPMKTYLIEYVISPLSQGLIACGSAWPEDPIDFLAEYLIKNNP